MRREPVALACPLLRRRPTDDRQQPSRASHSPLAVGRNNWLHIGGDGGLLSIAASVKRHGVNPWAYLTNILTRLPALRRFDRSTPRLVDVYPSRGSNGCRLRSTITRAWNQP